MSDQPRCRYCRKPVATDDDYAIIPEGDGAWLCWARWQGCDADAEEAIDLRDAEIAAEKALADRLAVAIEQILPAFGTGGDLRKAWDAWKEARR